MSDVNLDLGAPQIQEDAAARRRVLMAVPSPGTLDVQPALDLQPAEARAQPDPAAGAAYLGEQHTPEDAAAAIAHAQMLGGMDPSWVAGNLATLKPQAEQAARLEQLRLAPRLAAHLAQNPVTAAAAKDDTQPLGFIDRWLNRYWEAEEFGLRAVGSLMGLGGAAPPEWRRADEALAEGFRQQQQVFLATKHALGTATEQDLADLAALESRQPSKDGLAAPVLAPFRMAPYIAGSILARSAGTAAGGATPIPGGAAIGEYAGGAAWDFYQNFGPLFRQLRTLSDETGAPLLSDDEARAYAAAGSFVSAGITSGLGGRLVRQIPGVDAALRRVSGQAMMHAAVDPELRTALKTLLGYGLNVATGAAVMASQAGANAATAEIAKATHGQDVGVGPVALATWQAFKDAVPDMLLLAGVEPGRRYLETLGKVAVAPQEAGRLDLLVSAAKDSKLAERVPGEAERAIRAMAQESDAATVYVDKEAWDKHWTGKGLDPAEVAAHVIGDGGKAYTEAAATGADLAVPIEKHLVALAKEGAAEVLRQDVKLSPEGLTLREAGMVKPDAAAAVEALPPAQQEQVRRSLGAAAAQPPHPEPLGARALRELAVSVVEGKRLGEVQPGRYAQAARQASDKLAGVATEAAQEAVQGAGNISQGTGMMAASGIPGVGTAATRVGERQVRGAASALEGTKALQGARDFSRALAKAASEVRDEAEANRKFLLGYTKDQARGELGKAGGGYLEQVDMLLSGFELGQGASRTEVARRQATQAWIASEQAAGRDPIIPDSVLSKLDRFVHWKELTPQEMRDLRASVENIAHLATLKNTLLEKQQRVDREAGIASLITAVRDNVQAKPFRPTGSTVGNLEAALEKLQGLKYGARAMERVIVQLDGGDIQGPWHRFVWDPVNDGTHAWHDLVREVGKTITDQIDSMPKEDMQRWRETRFRVNGLDYDLTAAIAVALNSGNPSNIAKLEKGWRDPSVLEHGLMPWSETTREEFLSQLTRPDWEFVRRVGQAFESMWPQMAALEKKLTGLEPPKVELQPFTRTLQDGTTIDMPGHYYPVIYDRDFSRAGARQQEASDLRSVQLFDRDYYRAATPQGHLQERIEEYARPVLLSIDALPRKISEAAKDATMREALLSVHSALTDSRVRAALHTSEIGRAGEKALLGWLRDTANDLVVPDNGAGSWFTLANRTRAGYTASLFAYNIAQTLQNTTAIVPATRAVGAKWMASAMQRLATERGPLLDWIVQQSGEVRNREKSGQPIREALEEMARSKGLTSDFMQFGLKIFQATDTAVVIPAWLAGYMKATAEVADGGLGFDHATAVKHADATVRLNVLANNTKDLPAVLRSKVGRWMLPLYSYSAHRLNMIGDAVGLAHGALREGAVGKAVETLGGIWGAIAVEQILSELVKGSGPQDENGDGVVDAQDWGIWTAKIAVFAPITWIPVLGSAARTAMTGRDPLSTPEQSVIATVGRTARGAVSLARQALSDEPVDPDALKREAIHLMEVGGYLRGLPVSQLRATAGYLLDENSPMETPLQAGLGIAYGKSRPGKLLNLTE